jgi:hypothetical protein
MVGSASARPHVKELTMTFSIEVHLARTGDGKWVAATSASPYFCFESDSEAEVTRLAHHAVSFFGANLSLIQQIKGERERAAVPPVLSETRKELLYA